MIGDFLKRALGFARGYLWVSVDPRSSEGPRGSGPSAAGRRAPQAKAGGSGERRPAAGTSSGGKAGGAGPKASGKAAAKTGAETGTKTGTKAGTKTAATAGTKAGSKTAAKGGGKAAQGKAGKAPAKGTPGQATPAKSTKAPDTARSKPSANDDLTAIKGIGPALKKDLAGLGVATIQDLAKADAGELAGKLSQRTVTPEKVRGWIAEAQRRA